MRPLKWIVGSEKLQQPTELLAHLRSHARHLLIGNRSQLMGYSADWRQRCGLDPKSVAPVPEEQDRSRFEVYVGFDPLQKAMELGGLPWGTSGVEICHAVALWAEKALLCACARPNSRNIRPHPCHLEILVPFLVKAGWDVQIDGRLVTYDGCDCNRGAPFHNGDPEVPCRGRPWYAEGMPGPYRPEDFGWPALVVP